MISKRPLSQKLSSGLIFLGAMFTMWAAFCSLKAARCESYPPFFPSSAGLRVMWTIVQSESKSAASFAAHSEIANDLKRHTSIRNTELLRSDTSEVCVADDVVIRIFCRLLWNKQRPVAGLGDIIIIINNIVVLKMWHLSEILKESSAFFTANSDWKQLIRC